jgi:HK97 family phage major capsid protein
MSDKITLEKDELVKLLDEVSTKAAATAVEAKMKELGMSNHKFAGSFGSKSAEEIEAMDKKDKMASFIKAVYAKDMQSLGAFKALSEGTGSAGGFIVPEEFAAEVNRIIEDFGLVPKLCRKFPMKSDTLNVPRLSATVTVSYPGENTAGTGSQPTFEQVVLSSKTLVGITPMSNELLADANVSVVDLLVELFAEAIAGQLDVQGLTGTGAPFTGILTDTGVTVVQPANGTGNSTFALASTPDNMRDLITQVKPWALQGAAFIMHRSIWAILQKAKASTSGDYFISTMNPVLSGVATQGFPTAMAGTMWGYPVYLSDKMPSSTAVSTKYVIFGNLKHLYMGVRADMGVAISQEGVVASVSLFESNMSAVRCVVRHALAVGLPAAFSVLKTSAS